MKQMIADWHGEQAANYYIQWNKYCREDGMRCYMRHLHIAKLLWGRE